jgi:ABC-type branched-subunit amino acid transport system substrate-binding protein
MFIVVAIAALLVSCTSDPNKTSTSGDGGGGSGGTQGEGLAADNAAASSTTGISDSQINVAYIGVDFSALKSTGLVPDLGDQKKQVTSFVDDINEHGGIGGRKINLHFKMLDLLDTQGGNASSVIQAACIEATQEFKAAVVVLPPAAARDMARCTAVTNKTLTIDATAFDQALFEEAQGRMFSPGGMSIDRQFRAWADQMDELGVLDGKTVGLVIGDQPAEFVQPAKDVLIPELKKLGHPVKVSVTLPCAAGSTECTQYDSTAQKMKDGGVDTVFMALANTFGTGFVQASANIGFHPQWLLEGNQTTNTVLKFFDAVKSDIDGAIGVGFAFALPEDITDEAVKCNKIVTDRSGEKYEPGSDAFGFTSSLCTEFRILDQAGDKVPKAKLNQGAWISAIAGLGTIPSVAGPDGTLSPTKHDALDHLYLCDYKAAQGTCVRRSTPPFEVGS